MMVQKRPSAIGSGIGGGLKRPTMLKQPTNQNNGVSNGITGGRINNNPVNTRTAKSPSKLQTRASPKNNGGNRTNISSRLPVGGGSERNLHQLK